MPACTVRAAAACACKAVLTVQVCPLHSYAAIDLRLVLQRLVLVAGIARTGACVSWLQLRGAVSSWLQAGCVDLLSESCFERQCAAA